LIPLPCSLLIDTSKESTMSIDKKGQVKSKLLGMSFHTARARLERDLLFKFATELGHVCYRCQQPMPRDNFSVDHMENWSTAESPIKAYFDLKNVAFSHIHCNAANTSKRKYFTAEEKAEAKRQNERIYKLRRSVKERQQIRREQYLRTGK